MPLEITVRRSVESVDALAPEWAELHESSGTGVPFSSPEFALTWLRHFSDANNTPLVYEVREGGRLVGVAPYYRHQMKGGLARVQPVGTGVEWIAPFEIHSMLAAPAKGRDVARTVVAELCREPVEWDWANVALGDAAPWFEPEWLPAPSFTVMIKHLVGAVILDLTAGPVENLLTGRRNVKESIRRAKNRLNGAYGESGWSVVRATEPSDVAEALTRLVRLHEARSLARTHREVHANVFASPTVSAFVHDVVKQLAARRRASIYELVAGGEVLATQLILHTGSASYVSLSGISEEGWRFSPVTYVQWQAIRDAHAQGHREMNLSIGPNQTKLRWSNEVRCFPNFVVVGPRPRSKRLYPAAHLWTSLSMYGKSAWSRERSDPDRKPAVAGPEGGS